jgi:hypothetical protein
MDRECPRKVKREANHRDQRALSDVEVFDL